MYVYHGISYISNEWGVMMSKQKNHGCCEAKRHREALEARLYRATGRCWLFKLYIYIHQKYLMHMAITITMPYKSWGLVPWLYVYV